ncbi:MAG: hypothetical protein CTY13_00325 [Methylobacter sp.]|nr:MAG: hypothetical protein CTY13_00325 [Methylobacter sp.]
MHKSWWLYMLECKGGEIYTGIAIDVDERYKAHKNGKGAKYTKMNPPVRILARKMFPDRRSAARAEYEMKQMTPLKKWQWIYAFGFERIET